MKRKAVRPHTKESIWRKAGFTLLEIMIALAIIGITLTVILHTVNYHAGVLFENTMTTRMYQMAKEQLFNLESNPVNSKGQINGTNYTYENLALRSEDTTVVELKTVVRGNGREITLNELIIDKEK